MKNTIKISDEGELRLIELDGLLDSGLSTKLESVLLPQDLVGIKKVSINLRAVPEVTPDGVRVLLNASFNQNSVELQLQNPNEKVRQLMKTVGLEPLIK